MHAEILAGGLVVAILGFACSAPTEEQTLKTTAAVLNGSLSGPEEDYVVRVISTTTNGLMYNCSGALIAPNLVITSRLCLANTEIPAFTCDTNGGVVAGDMGAILLVDPARISIKGPNLPAGAKGVKIFSLPDATQCLDDLAVVQLDRSLSGVGVASLRLQSGVAQGERVRVVGFGLNSTDLGSMVGVRYGRSDLPIAKVGSSEFLPSGSGTPPRTFTLEGPVMCAGDGGGPALSASGAVLGTLSTTVSTCSSPSAINTFTQVASFEKTVIFPAFAAVGFEPLLEVNPPSADAGAGGAGGVGNTLVSTGGAGDILVSTGGAGAGGAASAGSGTIGSTANDMSPSNTSARTDGGCTVAKSRVGREWLAFLGALLVFRKRRPTREQYRGARRFRRTE